MTKISQLPTASSVDIGDASKLPLNSVNDFQTKGVTLEQLRDNYFGNLQTASLTIASADVLTLNATPLTIVPAVTGKAIEVISASAKLEYNSVQYATNTVLQLFTSGGDDAQVEWPSTFLQTGTTVISRAVDVSDKSNILVNADLQVTVETGNPTAGNSDITVYVLYRLI